MSTPLTLAKFRLSYKNTSTENEMHNAVVGEVNKLLKTHQLMYVVGYLEAVLSSALQQMPKEQAERLMQIYFYDRELPVNVS